MSTLKFKPCVLVFSSIGRAPLGMVGTVLRYSLACMVAGLLVLVDLPQERPHVPDLIRLGYDYALQILVVGRYIFDLGSC